MAQVTAIQRYLEKSGTDATRTKEERAAFAYRAQERRKKDPLKARYTSTKANAKRRGINFRLTEAEYRFLAETYTVCPLTGVELDYSGGGNKGFKTTAALDRIDNEGDYSVENCWFISASANVSKGNLTLKQMQTILAQAASRGIL